MFFVVAIFLAATKTSLAEVGSFKVIPMDKPVSEIELNNVYGQEINVNNLEAKVIVVNFWATWCGVCKKEMPSLNGLNDKFKDLHVVAVAEDSKKRVSKYLEDKDYGFTVLIDQYGTAMKSYSVIAFPHTFIIKEGVVVGHIFGGADFLSPESLDYFEALLES